MPGHVAVRDQLAVDIAADFTVPPAVVDVHNTDHVPLQNKGEKRGAKNERRTRRRWWSL